MHIHYLMLVHRNLEQVDRLINALEGKETSFYIHVDKKVSSRDLKKTIFFQSKSNVKILRSRKAIAWGGFNMVACTLELMKLSYRQKKQGYFILLSGQDFPLRPNVQIRQFLERNNGCEYLQFWQIPHHKWDNGGIDRFSYYWFIDKIGIEKSWDLFYLQKKTGMIRDFFEDFPPYGGSQWWCLTTDCVKYILDFLRQNQVYIDFFESTLIPDEMFFQTILINSDFTNRVVNDNLKYIDFRDNDDHPQCLKDSDFKNLICSNKLWARKFDANLDGEILDKLEIYISQNTNVYT